MKHRIFVLLGFVILTNALPAAESTPFDTKWIPSKPEMLTYKSSGTQGDGLYQVSIARLDSTIEVYMNIITPGFTKTVSGIMKWDMTPVRSVSKIIVNGQIIMNTECSYDTDSLRVVTMMKPYNQNAAKVLPLLTRVMDFSQIPLVARTLRLTINAAYSFQSLDPRTNTLVPLSLKVVGEGIIQHIDCYEVESNDFEGLSYLWIEKTSARRVIRIEQPSTNRVSELLGQ